MHLATIVRYGNLWLNALILKFASNSWLQDNHGRRVGVAIANCATLIKDLMSTLVQHRARAVLPLSLN